MSVRDAILLAIIIVGGTSGELCVTRAMKVIGEVHTFYPHHILRTIGRSLRVGWMWLGLCWMGLAFFSLLMLLSWENVSFVVPVTALSYVVGALGGKFMLGEQIEPRRWAGVALVCVGVLLVCIA